MHSKWKTSLLAVTLFLTFSATFSANGAFAQEPFAAAADGTVADSDPRLNVYHNIKKFGAVGNGVTDNSAALQAAINAGYAVMIPEGTYNFSTTLNLKKDSIIVGTGKRSILCYTGSGVAMREAEGSYVNGYDNLKLTNFTLTTNSYSQTGIELTNNYQVTMDGLFIDGKLKGFRTAGIHIIGGTPATNSAIIRITNGEIWFCVGDGIRVSGPGGAAGLWIERNHISGNAYGVNQMIPSGRYPSTNFQIKNNVIEANLSGAINAEVLYASSITGNYFENIDGSTATLVRIANQGFAQGINISENMFGGKKAAYNIDMNGPADVTGIIANNVFLGASVAAIRANVARGLIIENNSLEVGTVPTVAVLGPASRSVWIKDFNNASYISGGASTQPNLTVGGRMSALSFKQAAGPAWTSGSGAPAGACTPGSLYSRTDGGAKTTLYVCEKGIWTAK